MRFILIIFLLFSIGAVAQTEKKLEPKLENISWISGNWTAEAFGGIAEENWSEPNGDSMMASFRVIRDGKVMFYEIEIIRQLEDSLVLQLKHFNNDLVGWEEKAETVDFPLIAVYPDKVVFDGMSFEKTGKKTMTVTVAMDNDDKKEKLRFYYSKE